jgi:hypothetical protein
LDCTAVSIPSPPFTTVLAEIEPVLCNDTEMP